MRAAGLFKRFPCDEIDVVHDCDAPLGRVLPRQGDEEHRAVCHDPHDVNDRLLEIGANLRVPLVERRIGCG